MKKIRAQHVFSNTLRQWGISTGIFAALYAFFMWYHKVRGKDYSLFTTEKCLAIAAVFCMGFALALGPLSRFFPRLRKALPYRRSLGLLAVIGTVAHVLLCLTHLPAKFPDKYGLSFYVQRWPTSVTGIIALILLLAIGWASFPKAVSRLGRRRWIVLQKLSYAVLALTIVHLLSLGKVPGWIKWLQTFNKPLPPGAFTTTTFCLIVAVLKLVDLPVHGDTLAQPGQETAARETAETSPDD